MKYLFMLVTKDQFELPLAVADTRKELGKMIGISPVTIANSIIRARKSGRKSKYVRVEFEENDIE